MKARTVLGSIRVILKHKQAKNMKSAWRKVTGKPLFSIFE
jgi:hypothetical protein